MPLSEFENANLVCLASLAFDGFPNAKRDGCKVSLLGAHSRS
ncbi:hypothetical protein ALT721_2480002 [Alteromonas alvinellae]